MKIIKIIIKIILYYLKALTAAVIACFPRNKNIWLYGGLGGRFVDNCKYLFIYANENFSEIKHIWITASDEELLYLRNHNFLCYKRISFWGIYYALRAKVYVYSSDIRDVTNLSLSSGAFFFNLWHGLPLKKIGRDNLLHDMFKFDNKLEQNFVKRNVLKAIKSNAVLCPVSFFEKPLISAFGLKDESQLCFAPYPRTMPFYWNEKELVKHVDNFESDELKGLIEKSKLYKKVWIYMPTWREQNPDFIHEAIKDIQKLNKVCLANDILFVLKLHPNTNTSFFTEEYSNVILLGNKLDIYPFLPSTTTLLTDYSSIFLDYYILRKEVIFYPFDLADYKAKSRDMYFEYEDLAKGIKIYDFEELIAYLNFENESNIGVLDKDVNVFCPEVDWKVENIKNYIQRRIY